ncbi:MAG: FeoB-associated Cys-rich membrane protein [Clostridia bacterium]|nr:FeoB-associated Cys-rich membrane protein [Clostridia bacterium]MBR2449772.1 FeoB-associated Cys-rich membrane protein [Clostridia bacterium]
MQPIEIIVIIACVVIVAGVIVKSIIDKKKGKTSCGCDCSKCSGCSSCKVRTNKEDTNKL